MQKLPEGCSVPTLKALVHAKQSSMLRNSPMDSPVNEDRIRTMVESDGNEETSVGKEELEHMEKTTEVSANFYFFLWLGFLSRRTKKACWESRISSYFQLS